MKHKCYGCGVEKDMSVLEISPYHEQDHIIDDPIPPLWVLECEGDNDKFDSLWRVVVVCHECFHNLSPDMWISERCWKNINPIVPFERLPFNNLPMENQEEISKKWSPESYPILD